MPIVCTQRHDVEHERPVEAVAVEQPAAARRPVGGHLGRGEDAGIAHQPGHRRSMARRHADRPTPVATVPATVATTLTTQHQGVRVPGSILGNRVVRKEDPKFLTSGGRYLDDLNDVPELAGAAHVAYVRSAVAHGTITSIDTSRGRGDARRARRVHRRRPRPASRSPSPFNPTVAKTLLASDRVRYVGEPIAAVVAETREQAVDAAEAVLVDYDAARGRSSTRRRRSPATTLLYDGAGSNVVFDSTALGMPDLTGDEFFADCEVTVTGRFVNQRVAPCPLEVRGSAAAWIDGRLHQWVSTQHAQGIKDADRRRQRRRGRRRARSSRPTSAAASAPRSATYPEEIVLGADRQARSAARCAGRRRAASR